MTMNRSYLNLFCWLVAVAAAAAPLAGFAAEAPKAGDAWQRDWDAARAAARRENKPLMVVIRCER
jgi:hypothetical protein